MKKSLKRGFFLPETIVVIVVVVVILLNVYVTFASVYSNYRRSFKYNTLNALNASYSLKKYYESVDGLSSNELELNNYIFDITTNEKFDSSFYEKIKLNYEIEKIYLINPTKVQANLSNLNVNLRRYIKTLKNNTEIGIVIVTKNGEYSFAPINISKTLNCTYSGDLSVGAEFTDAQYTYRYKQQYNGSSWTNMSLDGWGVKLTDLDSTSPVTTKICSNINNKPIVSASYMFYNSKAESIDLSNFDTSNVVNMRSMFSNSAATYLDLSNFDTSNVTNMRDMFVDSKALYINMDNLDTSKVTTMEGMFGRTNVPVLDLSNFNTSNVTNMTNMFVESKATNINVSNLDTSKVTTMEGMFGRTNAPVLDLSNFNTSNVTNMKNMFLESKATSINVSSFDTSRVTNMQGMFARSGVTSLDLSSFNTSNVTNFAQMFESVLATTGYARTQADADRFNTSSGKPDTLTFTVR